VVAFVSVLCLLGTAILFVFQLAGFSRLWALYPSSMTIGGVPVGGLNRQQAAQRLLEVFSLPVELLYGEARIQMQPETVGFAVDLDAVLAAAEQERTRTPFWSAFWNYLWARIPAAVNIPLRYDFSEERLRAYLQDEITPRYDTPPIPALPQPGTVNFAPGKPGISLDITRAIPPIEAALASSSSRRVTLPFTNATPPSPTFRNLEVLLRQTVELSGFDGAIGVFLQDLQTGQTTHFVYNALQAVTLPPDVAFTASSTIKIPIMVSVFRELDGDPGLEVNTKLEEMIAKSINPSTDWLMQNVLDRNRGPLLVTKDMETLGLASTFLGGFFYTGAPLLLPGRQTPGNTHPEVNTDPDLYNQTTASEMGMLLTDIYQCADQGGGALIAAFGDEITQAECQQMINQLAQDKIGVLIELGVPDGTRVAHKHGWVNDAFFVTHNVADAAIVYTPRGDFVLTAYMYHPVQIIFDSANQLIADLASAAYNYYNLPQP
jgi:beta-lactamase class A